MCNEKRVVRITYTTVILSPSLANRLQLFMQFHGFNGTENVEIRFTCAKIITTTNLGVLCKFSIS